MSTGEFEYVRNLIQQHAGIVLEPGKEYLVESRLDPLAQQEGFPSVQDFIAGLRTSPFNSLHQKVVQAMTTNETYFFRDVKPFDALRRDVIPSLVSSRGNTRSLTFWCAASSSGQEPYSVVMLLREHFPVLSNWNVRFIASDLSTEVLARAIQGRYTQLEVNRGLPAALLVKYFRKTGNDWQIREDIRRAVEFRELNLAESWSFLPPADVILMRNVLIYFNVETKRDILRRVRLMLKPGGYLLLGASETTLNLDDSFARALEDCSGFYQVKTG